MRPKLPSGASPSAAPAKTVKFGTPKLARLKTLNTSSRTSSRLPWPMGSTVSLVNATSTTRRSGPRKSPQPVLPNVPAGCNAKACGLNHCAGLPVTALSALKPGA